MTAQSQSLALSFGIGAVLTPHCDLSRHSWPKQPDADFVLSVHGICFLPKQIILMDTGLALDLNTNCSQKEESQGQI